jgi:hypothetical protein
VLSEYNDPSERYHSYEYYRWPSMIDEV